MINPLNRIVAAETTYWGCKKCFRRGIIKPGLTLVEVYEMIRLSHKSKTADCLFNPLSIMVSLDPLN